MKTDKWIDSNKRSVQLLDMNRNVVKEFSSLWACGRFLGVGSINIRPTKNQPYPTRRKRDTGEKFYIKTIE